MGIQNKGNNTLVVMTNGDVYYIYSEVADLLAQKVVDGDKLFKTNDAKSGAKLRLHIPNISAIVEGNQNA